MPRVLVPLLLSLALATLAGAQCAWSAAGQTGCQPVGPPVPLPDTLEESSGVAFSTTQAGILWSHNDGGHEPALYAIDQEGHLKGILHLRGVRNRDWEDMASAPCPAGGCLYLADTGDNAEERPQIDIYRLVDPPALEQEMTVDVEHFPILLPDGPRDIEALFILPGEELYLITKGRRDPVTVYRYPPPLRPGVTVTVDLVQSLSDGPVPILSQVTGADASPDGRLVAVRTYQTLTFYRVMEGRLTPLAGGVVDLRTLQEPQGEAVAFGPDGQVALTTEEGSFGGVAALRILACPLGR